MTIVLDAAGTTLGHMATFVAKKALGGEEVIVLNAERVVISGKRAYLFSRYKTMYDAKSQTNPRRIGPKRPRQPDRFVRRAIRGMISWKSRRGQAAFKKVMVYCGEPKGEIAKRHNIDISKSGAQKLPMKQYDNYITVKELCEYLGGSR